MGTYPYLSLDQVPIDAELVRRLPRKLAYYHLALPLAIEGDEVSVALAYPDNALVLDVLEGILGAPIVPVQAEATHIRAVLDRVWQHIERPAPHILSWGSDTSAAEWARVVADGLAPIFGARVTDLRENEAETVIALSQHDQFTFTVISSVADVPPIDLVRHAATPILLLQGGQAHKAARLSGRILLSLRGHSPDLSALDWVIPMAKEYLAGVTTLAVAAKPTSNQRLASHSLQSLAVLLDPDAEPAQHLAECTNRLTMAGISGYLKLCQGDPIQQIVTEFMEGDYALLVLISEAHGDFVGDTLRAIGERHANYAILVVKPMLTI